MNPLRIFTALMGFLVAVLAIARDETTLGWVAIGFLGSSVGVRLVQRFLARRDQDDTDSTGPRR